MTSKIESTIFQHGSSPKSNAFENRFYADFRYQAATIIRVTNITNISLWLTLLQPDSRLRADDPRSTQRSAEASAFGWRRVRSFNSALTLQHRERGNPNHGRRTSAHWAAHRSGACAFRTAWARRRFDGHPVRSHKPYFLGGLYNILCGSWRNSMAFLARNSAMVPMGAPCSWRGGGGDTDTDCPACISPEQLLAIPS